MGILDKIKKVADVATAGTQLLDGFRSQNNEESTVGNQLPGSLQSQNDAQDSTASLTSGMYDASLEKLIDIALADGILTEKKRQILFRKAESLGIDLDEFEMVLEARIDQRQDAKEVVATEPLTSINKLLKMLDDAEEEIRNRKRKTKTKTSFSIEDSLGGAFDGLLSRGVTGAVIGAVSGGLSIDDDDDDDDDDEYKEEIIERKQKIILNFPIPNTKDEIIEFLTYAIPLAKKKGNFFTGNNSENEMHNEFVPAWKTKCEQIITKVKLSMKDDRQLMDAVMQYAVELGIKK
jgi:hypothetical protein